MDSDIVKTLKDMENTAKDIKMDIFRLCWYMRGGLTYSEATSLSPDERQIIGKLVKENIETTKKTGQPFF